MRILLVNDDGIDEEGLAEAERALSGHETWVVAPAEHCSGAGQSLGLYDSLSVERRGPMRWAVDGTPTDCVKLALTRLMASLPDLVVSGINPGANLANNVFYSGTVAAATEAAMWGIPAMAVSVEDGGAPRFRTASSVALTLLERGIATCLPPRVLLNVNVPDRAADELAGYEWTRTARFASDIPFEEVERGRLYRYGRFTTQAVLDEEGTDVGAVRRGMVSLTPLSTDRSHLHDLPGLESLNGGTR
jgi:5'-nucleotidase